MSGFAYFTISSVVIFDRGDSSSGLRNHFVPGGWGNIEFLPASPYKPTKSLEDSNLWDLLGTFGKKRSHESNLK